jgi:hypothetical protein
MSALPPITDIRWLGCDVRFVPQADMQDMGFVPGAPAVNWARDRATTEPLEAGAHTDRTKVQDRGSARRDWRLRKTRLEWLDGVEGNLLGERGKLLALLGQRLQLISRMAS